MDFEKNGVLKKIEESPEYREEERKIREEEFQEDVNEVLGLQEINRDKGVTVRDRKFIEKALKEKWINIARNSDGHIIACFYKEPLISKEEVERGEDQIFRIGGASSLGTKESKEKLIRILSEEMKKKAKETKAIGKTEKDSKIGKFVEKLGWEVLSFDGCQKKYPEFLQAYLSKSSKDPEEYKDAEFYVLSGEDKE